MSNRNYSKIIAANIAGLRKKSGMTQADLAEHLGYSDKSISKWERGESLPDVLCLRAIAELFGVTTDYMFEETHEESAEEPPAPVPGTEAEKERYTVNFRSIVSVAVAGVWLAAAAVFAILMLCGIKSAMPFVIALPVSTLLLVIFNSIWGRKKLTFYTVSAFVISVLFLVCWFTRQYSTWYLMLLGIPSCGIVALACNIVKKEEKECDSNPNKEE